MADEMFLSGRSHNVNALIFVRDDSASPPEMRAVRGTSAGAIAAAPASTSSVTVKTVNVTDAGVAILAANTARKGFEIRNVGIPSGASDDVFIGNSSVAVPDGSGGANQGFSLVQGEVFGMGACDGIYTGAIHGICNTGESSQVAVWEW